MSYSWYKPDLKGAIKIFMLLESENKKMGIWSFSEILNRMRRVVSDLRKVFFQRWVLRENARVVFENESIFVIFYWQMSTRRRRRCECDEKKRRCAKALPWEMMQTKYSISRCCCARCCRRHRRRRRELSLEFCLRHVLFPIFKRVMIMMMMIVSNAMHLVVSIF